MLSPGADRIQRPQHWVAHAAVPPQPNSTAPARLPVRLTGKGDSIMFDWGQETGGFTILAFGDVSDAAQSVSLAYSESSNYSVNGDHSNGGSGPDGLISSGPIAPNASYTPPVAHMRGGFRYLNLRLETDGWVDVQLPSVHFTAAPNMADPSAWSNHFFSSDDLLNRIWYGCGYTTQMCSIDPQHGRQWPAPSSGWNNSAVCGVGNSVLVDGAKRDRVIWPGDMGVSSLTAIATTGDLVASQNALATLYQHQLHNGMLPYAGPPVSFYGNSDTYHMWALIGTYNIAKHDQSSPINAWLKSIWAGFQSGVQASVSKVNQSSGLMNVTAKADWARGPRARRRELNCPANMLLYKVLTAAAELSVMIGNSTAASTYTGMATKLRSNIQRHLWDPNMGAFFDNTARPHQLYPQDGNSLAVWFNVTDTQQAASVSEYLQSNWGSYGASTPEWGNNIGTFPGSMEVHAHMAAGRAERAHALMRLQWGYMLNKPEGTRSTFWEGYNQDGSFAYQGIYMSNAHGWATGPAAALTFNTLGVRPASPSASGPAYVVAPQFGGLKRCSGKLAFDATSFVQVEWAVDDQHVVVIVNSSSMDNRTGLVSIDLAQLDASRLLVGVVVNEELLWHQGQYTCSSSESGVCAVAGISSIGIRRAVTGQPSSISDNESVQLHGVEPQERLKLELSFRSI